MNTENSITLEQLKKLEEACIAYESALEDSPGESFWATCFCDSDGSGPVPPEEARSILFEVYDFDGNHDFNWLENMLKEAGIKLNRKLLGKEPYTDEGSGDGYLCWNMPTMPIYSFSLRFTEAKLQTWRLSTTDHIGKSKRPKKPWMWICACEKGQEHTYPDGNGINYLVEWNKANGWILKNWIESVENLPDKILIDDETLERLYTSFSGEIEVEA